MTLIPPLPQTASCATRLRSALIALVLVTMTGAAWTPDEYAPARLQAEIEAALHREELAWQQNNAAQFSQFIDRQIAREWRRTSQQDTRS